MPEFTEPRIADLSTEQLAKVRDLEKLLGSVVVAYQQPVAAAQLTPQQLQALQQVEREIGACLVAYRSA